MHDAQGLEKRIISLTNDSRMNTRKYLFDFDFAS